MLLYTVHLYCCFEYVHQTPYLFEHARIQETATHELSNMEEYHLFLISNIS